MCLILTIHRANGAIVVLLQRLVGYLLIWGRLCLGKTFAHIESVQRIGLVSRKGRVDEFEVIKLRRCLEQTATTSRRLESLRRAGVIDSSGRGIGCLHGR
jgi:hypothetical protein